MAVLNKLRNSTWVLIVVLVSLGLFVASDYFSSSNKYNFGGSDQNVGEIDGKKISLTNFDERYKNLLAQIASNGSGETEENKEQASMYAWQQFVQEMVVDKEFEKLGIDVSNEEAGKLLYSEDAHPTIKKYFSNNGVFSPSNVIGFKNEQAKKDPKLMQQFELIINQIMGEVKYRKYNSLLTKSLYATSLDAEDELLSAQGNINGKSITLNYANIDDKIIKYTDADLKEYINKHKDEFKQKASRDLEYILIDVAPTKADTMALVDEMTAELNNFNAAENDSIFVTLNNSLTPFDTNYQSRGSYDKSIEAKLFSARKDTAFGPVFYNGGYSLFKVIDTKKDSSFYFHAIKVEIPIKGTTKMDTADALASAKKLIAEAGSDPNALDFYNNKVNSGDVIYAQDLGWLREGSQMEEVNKAMKTMTAGQSVAIKTLAGVSIVKLMEPKSYDLIKVAEYRKNVEPLQATEDAAFQKASNFRSSLTGKEGEFDVLTKKMGIAKSVANNVKETDKTMTGIPGTKEVVRWAYAEDREEGDNSDVITCENLLIVANLKRIKEEGTAEVDDVREKVTRLVINEKKAEILKSKFDAAMKSAKTMDQIATGVQSIVQPFNNISFYGTSVPFAGNDPKLIGYICGLKLNQISRPIVSNDGVHVFLVENASFPQIPADLKQTKDMIYSQKKQQVYNLVLEAIKKARNVKDERGKFY